MQTRQLIQIDIHRMESVNRDAVIGIRIHPGVRHRRIVDGQDLDDSLSREDCPIDHLLQIPEIAYAPTGFRTKRKDRNRHSGCFPKRKWKWTSSSASTSKSPVWGGSASNRRLFPLSILPICFPARSTPKNLYSKGNVIRAASKRIYHSFGPQGCISLACWISQWPTCADCH